MEGKKCKQWGGGQHNKQPTKTQRCHCDHSVEPKLDHSSLVFAFTCTKMSKRKQKTFPSYLCSVLEHWESFPYFF